MIPTPALHHYGSSRVTGSLCKDAASPRDQGGMARPLSRSACPLVSSPARFRAGV